MNLSFSIQTTTDLPRQTFSQRFASVHI